MITRQQHLDRDEAAKSFQKLLDGVDLPTSLPLDFKGLDRSHEISVVQQKIVDTSYAQVRNGVLDAEVNEDTLVQLAWAVLLGRYGAGRDVVFGGSSPPRARGEESDGLSNIDGIKGPIVAQVDPDQTVRDSLQALYVRQLAMVQTRGTVLELSLIHISEPTRPY